MAKSQGLMVGLAALVVALLAPGMAMGQGDNSPRTSLRLQLSVANRRFVVGKPVYIRVELWNQGTDTIFVGSEMPVNETWIYYLALGIEDSDGNGSPGLWGTRHPVPPDPKESLATALAKAWITLPPGYFYGTTIEIDSDMFEFLKKPGEYCLRGKYVSLGIDAPLYYNAVAKKPEEMAKLPFRGWKGETEGNSLWIEIGPPNTGEKQE